MELSTLKKFIWDAIQIETALTTEKNVYDEYKVYIKTSTPKAPTKEFFGEPPAMPKQIIYDENNWKIYGGNNYDKQVFSKIGAFLFLGGGIFLILFPFLAGIFEGFSSINFETYPILLVLGIGLVFWGKRSLNSYKKAKKDQYVIIAEKNKKSLHELNNYENELENYKKRKQDIEIAYSKACDLYHTELSDFQSKTQANCLSHDKLLTELENAREEIYKCNIIYPKYRNLIALSMIYEYLDSGRCDALEGTNGAYNLYELELRQNLIINSLASIMKNLDAIQSNQYLLYQQLQQSNATLNELKYEMYHLNDNTKMTAYFAQATAIAAAAPRISHGYIF